MSTRGIWQKPKYPRHPIRYGVSSLINCATLILSVRRVIGLARGRGASLILLRCNTGWRKSLEPSRPAFTPACCSIRTDGICRTSSPSRKHHLDAVATQIDGAQSSQKYLAVHPNNWLSNRVFKSYDDIVGYCCDAWNKLIDQPWKIMSMGLRDWAHQ
jgi:hypothetical protein